MRISDWSSDVCSSDLRIRKANSHDRPSSLTIRFSPSDGSQSISLRMTAPLESAGYAMIIMAVPVRAIAPERPLRSEEHTSELQSLMRISYAVFCLKKKTKYKQSQHTTTTNKYQ